MLLTVKKLCMKNTIFERVNYICLSLLGGSITDLRDYQKYEKKSMSLEFTIAIRFHSSKAHIGVWLLSSMCEFKDERASFILSNSIIFLILPKLPTLINPVLWRQKPPL